ncbi:MAG TPA: L,D-transpeptidase [Bryobacteraceae bacterium]|nr:L,D-transpeptidase [Bryobacteraceae bacterium]
MKAAPAAQPAQYDATAINDPNTRGDVTPKSAGSAVVRMQILLDRAHFSPGQIDGQYGENLRIALQAYQAAHQLPVTGVGDAGTWQALDNDNAPVLVPYVITPQDTAGPFQKIPADMMQQAKLKFLGYESPEDELGERFHISPALLSNLNPGKNLANAGEQIMVPNVQRNYMPQAAKIVVSRSRGAVTVLAPDETILAQYPATMGSEHDPLPIGEWKITGVQQNPPFHYNPDLFWDAKPEDSKATIAPGPRNPVGVVWIALSKEHYGIHGTPRPGEIGHTESHGCIRLTNWDAEELSHMVKPGTPAILQE